MSEEPTPAPDRLAGYYETPVDRAIRQAQERGEFDNLPGAGKPLDLGDPNDPDWWVKAKMERENLDPSAALPTVLGLRKEAETYPGSLVEVAREEQVREILDDYNRRVRIDRLRPAVGNLPPLLARTIDVDAMVGQWRELRAELAQRAAAQAAAESAARAEAEAAAAPSGARSRWRWRRRA